MYTVSLWIAAFIIFKGTLIYADPHEDSSFSPDNPCPSSFNDLNHPAGTSKSDAPVKKLSASWITKNEELFETIKMYQELLTRVTGRVFPEGPEGYYSPEHSRGGKIGRTNSEGEMVHTSAKDRSWVRKIEIDGEVRGVMLGWARRDESTPNEYPENVIVIEEILLHPEYSTETIQSVVNWLKTTKLGTKYVGIEIVVDEYDSSTIAMLQNEGFVADGIVHREHFKFKDGVHHEGIQFTYTDVKALQRQRQKRKEWMEEQQRSEELFKYIRENGPFIF